MVDTTCGPCKKIGPTACTDSRGWFASLASRGQLAVAAPRGAPPRRTRDNRRSRQRWPAVRPAVRRRWNPWRWHPPKRPVLLPVLDSSGACRRQHSCRRHPPPRTLRNGGGGGGTAGTRAAADTAARVSEGPTRRRCGAKCWRARQLQRRSRSRVARLVARLVARRRVQWHRCGQRLCMRRQEWGAVSTATSFVSAKTFSPWLRGAAVRDARPFFRRGARTRSGRLTRTRGVDVHCFSRCQKHHYVDGHGGPVQGGRTAGPS